MQPSKSRKNSSGRREPCGHRDARVRRAEPKGMLQDGHIHLTCGHVQPAFFWALAFWVPFIKEENQCCFCDRNAQIIDPQILGSNSIVSGIICNCIFFFFLVRRLEPRCAATEPSLALHFIFWQTHALATGAP